MTKNLSVFLILAGLVIAGALLYFVVAEDGDELPVGFVQGNGRVEAEQVEIAPTNAGRVAKVTATEGSMVAAGQILAEMDIDELSAALDRG